MPLTSWWDTKLGTLADLSAAEITKAVNGKSKKVTTTGSWILRLIGTLVWARAEGSQNIATELPKDSAYKNDLAQLLKGLRLPRDQKSAIKNANLWSVNRNREASISTWTSTKTIKADAARQLFSLKCRHLNWAILDTGIDATHPAFRKRSANGKFKTQGTKAKNSRVKATYDFSRVRDLLDGSATNIPDGLPRAAELRRRLRASQTVDWDLLEDFLRVEHDDYQKPEHSHGTHVAGIMGADWRTTDPRYEAHSENDLIGVCPDINFYDLRVLGADGTGDEFSILAAMQFIRYINSRNRTPIIHGVNLSLSIPHDVSNFACGRTPICQEAERLQGTGVVVVAAAGNRGYARYLTPRGETEAYHNISVTDPGNAEKIITVGATHRGRPHTYGVSYFSSRGPTGDGRLKPDLVAPGEKITGPILDDGAESMDGTSMAAPHVSGAAALIMSRHPEFIGDPDRIKHLLSSTATDLGRERYFQGAGLVDICRALQSV